MKRMSVIRFKPKPDCYDEFLAALTALQAERAQADPPAAWTLERGDKLVRVVIRDEEEFAADVSNTHWLDSVRHLLEEFNEVDRHAIVLTGEILDLR